MAQVSYIKHLFCFDDDYMLVTATSTDGDYDLLSEPLTFQSGSADSAEMCASVSVNFDVFVEIEENFTITLSLVTSGANLNIANNISAVTLSDSNGRLW